LRFPKPTDQQMRTRRIFSGILLVVMKKKILFPLAALLLVFAFMEVASWVTLKIAGGAHPPMEDAPMADSVEYNLRHVGLTAPDPELIFRVRPNPSGGAVEGYEGINSLGFRGGQFDQAPPGAERIMVVGDSNGFGWGLPRYGDTWPAMLEAELAKEGVTPWIYNISQPGHSTHQAGILFDRWHEKIDPSFVIFHLGWNDIWSTPGLTDKETIRALRISANPLARTASATNTYALVQMVLHKVRGGGEAEFARRAGYGAAGMKTRVPLEESIDNMEKMVTDVIRGGARPIVILPPYALMMNPELKAIDKFNAAVFARLQGRAMFIHPAPMRGANPRNWRFFIDDGFHANMDGARLLAEEIAHAVAHYSVEDQSYTAPEEWTFPAFAMPKEIGGEEKDDSSLAGIVRTTGDPPPGAGALVFGPYIRHECALASAIFRMKSDSPSSDPLVTIDVATDEGKKVLVARTIAGQELSAAEGWTEVALKFATPSPVEKLETRIRFHGGGSLAVDTIRVRCLNGD